MYCLGEREKGDREMKVVLIGSFYCCGEVFCIFGVLVVF